VQGAPSCVAGNVGPAIVRVPVRGLVLVLAVTDQVTDPLPVPLAGAHVSQLVALLEAVQVHPAPAVTVTVPVPAAEPGLALAGENDRKRGAPGCAAESGWRAESS